MIKIRQIEPKDNDAVKKLVYSIMADEFQVGALDYATDDLEDTCKHYSGKNEVFYVAEDSKGDIVGTVGVKYDGPHIALVRRLFLKKTLRRKGCGTELLKQALEYCKKHGYKKIIFRGIDAMEAAYKTCLKNGFSERDILVLPHAKMFNLELSI